MTWQWLGCRFYVAASHLRGLRPDALRTLIAHLTQGVRATPVVAASADADAGGKQVFKGDPGNS